MARLASWKWKVAGLLLALALFLVAFSFTPSGQDWLKKKIDAGYEATPPEARRDSAWAGCFLALAWFKGNIAQEPEKAMQMYRDFCGILPNAKDSQPYESNLSDYFHTRQFSGKCSPDGKTGWGPMHPRAPEAFWEYLQTHYSQKTGQRTIGECLKYHKLFYTWMIQTTHKPHPEFNKYWPKIKDMLFNLNYFNFPPTPLAEPYKEP